MSSQYELGSTKLFEPITIGDLKLKHRAFYPPTTRQRASLDGVPTDLMYEYYDRRSQNNGGLLITEGTFISQGASGNKWAPGIYSDLQIKSWKKIVDKVHANGTAIAVQLWNQGRVAQPDEMKRMGQPLVAPSLIYDSEEAEKNALANGVPLRELTLKDIEDYKQTYVTAAKNAVNVIGFDLIELHDAHGYFLDQFLNPSTNQRSDKYGGSIENRARLVLEIIDLMIPIIGAKKIGIRVSPWATFQGMKAEEEDVHPIAQVGYLLSELNKREIAYVSIVEPRVSGIYDVDLALYKSKSNDWMYQIFNKGLILRAGNYLGDRDQNYPLLRGELKKFDNSMFGFARFFTSNPDLIHRLKEGLDLTPYNRPQFYTRNNDGYNTWTNYDEKPLAADDPERQREPVALF